MGTNHGNKLTVVVCAHNEEAWLESTLHSLLAQERAANEIIVVNNASTDGTADLVLKFAAAHPSANVKLVNEARKGLHHAREIGWRTASSEIIVATDADIRFPTKWLKFYEEEFAKWPDVAAMSGPVFYYDAPAFINWATWGFEMSNQPEGFGKLFTKRHNVNGGNSAYRRSALL